MRCIRSLARMTCAVSVLTALIMTQSTGQTYSSEHIVFSGGATLSKGKFTVTDSVSATVMVGQPFVSSTVMAGGTYRMELGFWTGRLRRPGTPDLTASFEDYPDKIILRWAYDPNIPPTTEHHEVYKAGVLLKDNLHRSISTYTDQSSELAVGTSYSYSLKGLNPFGVTPIPAQTVGKTSSAGEITGRIVTTRGSKIAGATVKLTPNWGNALYLDGTTNRAELPFVAGYDLRNNSALPQALVELWIRPALVANHTVLSDNQTWELFLENQGGFTKLGYREIQGSPITHYVDADIAIDGWTHVALAKDTVGGTARLRVFFDDSLMTIGGQPSVAVTHAASTSPTLYVGSKGTGNLYRGYLDELRTWSSARTDAEIRRDHDRYLYYRTPDSVVHPTMTSLFPMDDLSSGATMTNAVNPSKSGSVLGVVTGTWSTSFRSPSYATVTTDVNGTYRIIKIPYGNGTNFTLTPSKPFHIFDPPSRLVYLFEFSPVANNQDFTVTNLISISGFVEFDPDNTNNVRTGEKGVEVLVNGSHSGQQTNANGFYSVEVEPGSDVTIAMYKASRDSVAFIPQKYIFLNTVENKTANFIDRKARDLVTTVTGGSLGLPLGPANLVTVTVRPTSGLWEKSAPADARGQYVFRALPPQPYQVFVTIDKTVPGAGRVPEVDAMQAYFGSNGKTLDTEKSYSLAESDWIGERDSVGLVFRSSLVAEVRGFRPNAKGDFGFVQNKPDTLILQAYERYYSSHPDTAFVRSPLDSAEFRVFDYVSDRWSPGFSKDTVKLLGSSSGMVRYEVMPGKPNISSSGDNPFKKKVEIEVTDKVGRKAGDVQWAVVLGNLPQQMDFTTTAPDIPFLILRRPPGDASVSSFSRTQSQSTEFSITKTSTENAELEAELNLGVKVTTIIGLGVSTELSVEAKYALTAGLSTTFKQSSATSQVVTVSTQNTYSTGLGVGEASEFGDLDLFVGGAMNLLYGITKVLSIKYFNDQPYYDVANQIIFVPDGFATTFAYSRKYIEELLIPELNLLATADPRKREDVRRWQQVLAREDRLRWSAIDTANYSFEGAAGPLEFSRTSEVSKSERFDVELEINTQFAQEVGVLVNESIGAGVRTKIGFGINVGSSQSSTATVSNTTSYVLDDDDFGDDYTVNIGGDPVYGTPVFTVIAGHSSCPYEEWKNEQGNVVTIPRDAAFMEWQGPSVINNVPPGDPADFRLLLRNDANEERTYLLSLVQSSNPKGAKIEINGQIFTQPISYTLPANEGFEASVRVWKPEGSIYEFSNLRIKFSPECETSGGGTDGYTLPFTANFARPCTDATIDQPQADWIVNTASRDTLDVIVSDFDLSQTHFEKLLLQYRPLGGQTWFTIDPVTVFADTLRSQNAIATRLRWAVGGISDGVYDIRVATICLSGLLTNEMGSIRGTIDRARPTVLGAPEPTDRVLNITDEIAINFTEPINPSSVRPQNIRLIDGAGVGEITDLTVTVSENRLVIRPNIPASAIENHYLEAGVWGYTDANGNPGDSVGWNFTVNRNPVSWNQPIIDVESFVGEDNVFQIKLNNIGSSAEPFEIQGLPSWLLAAPMQGEINPGGSFTVSFAIERGLNVGEFTQYITAHTAKGDEPLRLNLVSMCRYPAWDVRPADYQYSMTIVARAFIRGTKSQDRYDRVGAFVNDECRGVANVVYDQALGDYVAYLTVYSNIAAGEEVKFHLWDRTACREYWGADATVTFSNDATVGSPLSPLTLNATGTLASSVGLSRGFTWFSVNVRNPDGGQLDSVFQRLPLADGDRIIGQTAYAQYVASTKQWVGPLASSGIEPGRMYVGDLDSAAALNYVGYEIGADTVDVTVAAGWSWLGFLPSQAMEVAPALAGLNKSSLDLVKDQVSFAQYTPPYGWLGSMQRMFPGKGYKLKSAEGGVFRYPPASSGPLRIAGTFSAAAPDQEGPVVEQPVAAPWTFDATRFPQTMTMTAFVESDSAGYNDPRYVVAAFAGDELRGMASPEFVAPLQAHRIFMVIHGTGQQSLTFKLFDGADGSMHALKEREDFVPDRVIGDPIHPRLLTRSAEAGAEIPETFSMSDNYPNPFNPLTNFTVGIPIAGNVRIAVYNVLGQRVRSLLDAPMQAGFHRVAWDGVNDAGDGASSGTYLVVMTAESFRQVRKITLIR